MSGVTIRWSGNTREQVRVITADDEEVAMDRLLALRRKMVMADYVAEAQKALRGDPTEVEVEVIRRRRA